MPVLIPSFLSAIETAALRAHATSDGWTAGRQGTGYDILPLRDVAAFSSLVARGRAGARARGLAKLGTPFEDCWDTYLIRYQDGSSIPAHTDAAQHGRRHRRINAVLEHAARGGELFVDGAKIELAVGDAVLFFPDQEVHEVTIVSGQRLMFSVGAWV